MREPPEAGRDDLEEILEHFNDGHKVQLMDGYMDCIAGIVTRYGHDGAIACYDRGKIIQKLMDRDGMTREEAEEFHDFNQAGAWVGPKTPCFLWRIDV